VVKNAQAKAGKTASRFKDAVIIGADTLVSFDRRIIGKPRTKSYARRLLKDFSGKRMAVFTGLCVIDTVSGKSSSGYEKSYLYTKKIDSGDIGRYLDALAPYDKAGGFSIEGVGSLIFDNIRGSYFNILGLPMGRLDKLFKDAGLDLLDFAG
jgi:septum formation protein